MTRAARMAGVAAVWFAAAIGTTVVALLMASRAGPEISGGLGSRPGLLGSTLDRGLQVFAPVSPRIVADLLGNEGLERLFGPETLAAAPTDAGGGPTAGPGRAASSTPASTTTPGPTDAGARVLVDIKVDSPEARPGDVLTYTVVAVNRGSQEARGVVVTSHVPQHTTFVAGDQCGGENVRVNEDPSKPGGYSLCTDLPGGPTPGEHGFYERLGTLAPGESRTLVFKVSIDANTPAGTVIRNHAHVEARDLPSRTTPEVATVVRLS